MSESAALVPYGQLEAMAQAFAKSGMFGAKTPEQALSLLLLAQAEGVHPAIAMRDYDIIQGRPAKKAEAMQRSFLAHGGKIEWHKYDDTGADATFSHPQGGTLRVSWDMARAEKAGLSGKDNYKKNTRQMFGARVISEGVRKVFPAATSGLYVPEEVREFEKVPEKDMGNAEIVGAPTQEDACISFDQAIALEDALKSSKSGKTKAKLLANVSKQYGQSVTSLQQIKAKDYDDAMQYAQS